MSLPRVKTNSQWCPLELHSFGSSTGFFAPPSLMGCSLSCNYFSTRISNTYSPLVQWVMCWWWVKKNFQLTVQLGDFCLCLAQWSGANLWVLDVASYADCMGWAPAAPLRISWWGHPGSGYWLQWALTSQMGSNILRQTQTNGNMRNFIAPQKCGPHQHDWHYFGVC